MGALYALAVRLQARCKLRGCLVQSSGSCSPLELGMPATAFVRGPRSSAPTPCPTTSTWPSSLAHFPARKSQGSISQANNGAGEARDVEPRRGSYLFARPRGAGGSSRRLLSPRLRPQALMQGAGALRVLCPCSARSPRSVLASVGGSSRRTPRLQLPKRSRDRNAVGKQWRA